MTNTYKTRHALGTGHVGNPLEDKIEDEIPSEQPKIYCPHHEYCTVKKFGRINCLTKSSVETCQSYKFYNRYGDGGNFLGI